MPRTKELEMRYRVKASEYSQGLVKCAVVGHVEKVAGPRDAKPFGDKGQIHLAFVVGEQDPDSEDTQAYRLSQESLSYNINHPDDCLDALAAIQRTIGLIRGQGFKAEIIEFRPTQIIREFDDRSYRQTLGIGIQGSLVNTGKTTDDYGRLGDLLQEEGILSAAQAALVRRTPFLIEPVGRASGASRSASPARH